VKTCGPPEEKACKFASQAAHDAVRQTFAILGVDVDSPKEVEEFRKSLRFGDSMRKAADKGLLALVVVITGLGVAALLAGLGIGVKAGGQ
jgi:hypothetical protein